MPFQRSEHAESFTIIDNSALRDEGLSLPAKGLLCYLLMLPDDWEFSIEELSRHSKSGIWATRTALKELEAAGYLIRSHPKNPDGTFDKWRWTVVEAPQCKNLTVEPTCENVDTVPQCGNLIVEPVFENLIVEPTCENGDASPQCRNARMEPQCGFPQVENPHVENLTQQSTYLQMTDLQRAALPCMEKSDGTSWRDLSGEYHRSPLEALEASFNARGFKADFAGYCSKVAGMCTGECGGEHMRDCFDLLMDSIERCKRPDPWRFTEKKIKEDRGY